jgi:oligopeptidase B
MKTISLLMAIFILSLGINGQNMNQIKPPVAKKEPKVLKIHGYEIVDNYSWLRSARDKDGKVRKEVEDYLVAENAYTDSIMNSTKDFQDALYTEMLAKIKQTDLSLPTKIGNYWYYTKTEEGKQYPIFVRATKGTNPTNR